MADTTKVSHQLSSDEQADILQFARALGDAPETTNALRRHFGLSEPSAYYWRRKAFGYRRGQRLPVRIALPAALVDQIDALVEQGVGANRVMVIQQALDAARHAPERRHSSQSKENAI